jgi:hypothetical protein
MSMICNLRRVSVGEIDRLVKTPDVVRNFLYGEPPPPPGFLARLFGSPPPAPIDWAPRRPGDEVDIEKAWHGLHFMFTGTAWEGEGPAAYLLVGGEPIGTVDVGYGPARALLPGEVREFVAYLSGLSEPELRQRYDPPRMTALQIYPEIWDPGDDDEQIEYLVQAFAELRAFLVEARDTGDGVLIYLN